MLVFRRWKTRRFRLFTNCMDLSRDEPVLDMGGCIGGWDDAVSRVKRVDCINIWPSPGFEIPGYRYIQGDACRMDFPDQSYALVYSNSTIEHVGDWQRQAAFANEARRVGRSLWVQTPALECPIEPHLMLPFVNWMPRRIRRRLAIILSPRTWLFGERNVGRMVDDTRLLSRREMHRLFPDCHIHVERIAWIFPKSYIAIRKAATGSSVKKCRNKGF